MVTPSLMPLSNRLVIVSFSDMPSWLVNLTIQQRILPDIVLSTHVATNAANPGKRERDQSILTLTLTLTLGNVKETSQ